MEITFENTANPVNRKRKADVNNEEKGSSKARSVWKEHTFQLGTTKALAEKVRPTGRQRPLSMEATEKANAVKQIGACWRCRILKKPCNVNGKWIPCDLCKSVRNAKGRKPQTLHWKHVLCWRNSVTRCVDEIVSYPLYRRGTQIKDFSYMKLVYKRKSPENAVCSRTECWSRVEQNSEDLFASLFDGENGHQILTSQFENFSSDVKKWRDLGWYWYIEIFSMPTYFAQIQRLCLDARNRLQQHPQSPRDLNKNPIASVIVLTSLCLTDFACCAKAFSDRRSWAADCRAGSYKSMEAKVNICSSETLRIYCNPGLKSIEGLILRREQVEWADAFLLLILQGFYCHLRYHCSSVTNQYIALLRDESLKVAEIYGRKSDDEFEIAPHDGLDCITNLINIFNASTHAINPFSPPCENPNFQEQDMQLDVAVRAIYHECQNKANEIDKYTINNYRDYFKMFSALFRVVGLEDDWIGRVLEEKEFRRK